MFPDDLDKLAKEMDVVTMEVSAKTGENIKELFEQLLTRVPITEISQNLSMASPSNGKALFPLTIIALVP